MGAYTVEMAQAQFDIYLAAETAIATGAQSYMIGNRSLTRANLSEITTLRKYWGAMLDRLSAGNGGARVIQGVPRDS